MKHSHVKLLTWLLAIISFTYNVQAQSGDYVTLQGRQFKLKGQDFYPVSMNYIIDIVHNDQYEFHIAPHHSYFNSNYYECGNEQDCFNEIVDDFNTIKSLGFNSIRLVGLEFGAQKQNGTYTTSPAFKSKDNNNTEMITFISSNYANMFSFIQRVLDAAALADIKVQLLVGGKKIDTNSFRGPYLSYLQSIALHFSGNSTLYSYDFKNEPLYFDNKNYSKEEVCNLVEDWHLAIKNNSTYHLTTLGLATSSEVAEWDPGVLKLDFLSFHLYSDSLDIVESEIKWISETSRLPWIIGETSFAASISDTVGQGTLQDQRVFAKATLEITRDCGGSGYSWWMYQDVDWGFPEMEDYFGLVNHQNNPKPASMEFTLFNSDIQGGTCIVPSNYYNFYEYSNYNISGVIKDQNNQPIKNAVIIGWDANWENMAKTYSQYNGQFTLYADTSIKIVRATAVGASVYVNHNATGYLNISLNQFQPVQDITVNNIEIQLGENKNYEASNSINSFNVTVKGNGSSGGECSMKATQIVKLSPGFLAQKGSYFHAYNEPICGACNNFSGFSKIDTKGERPPRPISPKREMPKAPIDK